MFVKWFNVQMFVLSVSVSFSYVHETCSAVLHLFRVLGIFFSFVFVCILEYNHCVIERITFAWIVCMLSLDSTTTFKDRKKNSKQYKVCLTPGLNIICLSEQWKKASNCANICFFLKFILFGFMRSFPRVTYSVIFFYFFVLSMENNQ